MKIAIDFDGTLYETEKEMRVEAEVYDIEELHGKGIINKGKTWVQEKYEWTDEEKAKFISKFVYITKRSDPLPGAKEIFRKFKDMGIELILITARGDQKYEDDEQMIQSAKDKLEKDGFHFSKMIFKTPDKVQTCIDEKVDFMIDDSPEVCQSTTNNKIKTIFMHDGEVHGIENPNEYLYEVGNWGEAYRVIYNYMNK